MAIGSTTASNPVSTTNADPMAEQNKQIKQQNAQNQQAWQSQQPMVEGNQQSNFIPLNKNAYNVQNQTMNTTQGNDAVLSKLQQTVLGQQQSQVMPLLQQQTSSYLQDPNLGYNPAANKQMQLEQYDRQASQAAEAARQQLGDTSQSGELKSDYLKTLLTNVQNRGDLSRKIDTEAATQNQTNLLNALAQGRAQVGTENETNTANINDLVAARGAAEGERSQDSANAQQMAVLDKTYGQDMAKLVATQNWTGAQNELDRQAAIAKQNNDIAAQQNIVKLQASLDMDKLKATQDWQSAQNDIQRAYESASQDKDIAAQSSIVDRQLALDKWKQENGQQFTAEQNAINNALQLTLKDKDAALQTSLMELKGKIDKDQLVTAQDFESVQNDLDRKSKELMAKGEWQNALDVIQQKGQIDAQAQKAQQEFEVTQTKAAQAWQTSERLGEEDFAKYQQTYDYQMKIAMQDNDIQAQKDLKDQQAKIDLKMKTQDLSDDEAKMYLQSQLDEAKANNDVDRQKQIIGYQTTQDFAKMAEQNGYDTAMANLDAKIKSAQSSQDFQQTEILQKEKMAQESTENAKDRALEQAKVDLQAKGVDMEEMDKQYAILENEVNAGRADPSALTEFAQGVLDKAGVTITQPDPDAERKAAEKQYNDMLDQYLLSHPEYSNSTYHLTTDSITSLDPSSDAYQKLAKVAGKSLTVKQISDAGLDLGYFTKENTSDELTTEGQKAFNEFFNNATYGELTDEQKAEKETAGYLSGKDIAIAEAGQKVNVTEATTYNGNTIPVGKYNVVEETDTKGNDFTGNKASNKKYLVSEDGKTKIEIGSQDLGRQGTPTWKKLLDPINLFGK